MNTRLQQKFLLPVADLERTIREPDEDFEGDLAHHELFRALGLIVGPTFVGSQFVTIEAAIATSVGETILCNEV